MIDLQVFEDLLAELKRCPTLHHTRLALQVQDGVVTISGRVNTLAERKAVERVARRVAGIKTLSIEITAAAMPITVERAEMDGTIPFYRASMGENALSVSEGHPIAEADVVANWPVAER